MTGGRLDNAGDRALSPGLEVTADELCSAIREGAGRSRLPGHAGDGEVVELRFGEQLDTRVLRGNEDSRSLTPEQVAAYVAKYSRKGSHHTITRTDSIPEQLRQGGVPEQLVQMAAAAIRLSKRSGLHRIGKWVHMLGFRGHFVTKSRAHSTTLGELRGTRAKWRADRDKQLGDDDSSTPVPATWQYIGSGCLNPGDVRLAAGVEASIHVAREALLDLGPRTMGPRPVVYTSCF